VTPAAPPSAALLRTALADAWEAQGRLRSAVGGAVATLPGVRLMASGLPQPHFNGGDVSDPDLVDIDDVRRWYAGRRLDGWGLRVPAAGGQSPRWGRSLLTQRLMGLTPAGIVTRRSSDDLDHGPPAVPGGLRVRPAGPADLDQVVAVDAAAFDTPPGDGRPWLAPLLAADQARVVLALAGGRPVGTGYALATTGRAGPAAFVGGVGVLPDARRLGVGTEVSRQLVDWGFAGGAALAHLFPDTEAAARVYGRLGFVEAGAVDILVDC
jgi:GNAT superfamily N-acetyltransferase